MYIYIYIYIYYTGDPPDRLQVRARCTGGAGGGAPGEAVGPALREALCNIVIQYSI